MDTTQRRLLLALLKVFNLGLMVLSSAVTTVVVFSQGKGGVRLSHFLSMRISLQNFVIAAMILVVWHVIFLLFGLYESSRLATVRSLIADTAKATTFAILCLAIVAQLFKIRMATPRFLLVLWALSSVSVVGTRVIIRYLLQTIRRRGRNLRYVLVLGTNSRARAFAQRIACKPELGYRVLGFVDDEWPGLEGFRKTTFALCCNFHDLPEYLRRNVIDEVAI